MSDNPISPINELFTDTEPIDVNTIVSVLKNFIRIKRDTNEIFFTEVGNQATAIERILIFALGRKVLKVGGHIDSESFSAKEVSALLQLKKGTVDATFSILRNKSFILGSGSKYVLPNYKITDALNLLKSKNEQSR